MNAANRLFEPMTALSAPVLALAPLAALRAEPTPVFNDVVLNTKVGQAYAVRVLAADPEPPWVAGASAPCPACGRELKARRDGKPVRHKVPDKSVWCPA